MCQRGGRRWDGKKERNKANKSRNKRETARPRPRGGWRRLALPIDGHDILPPCQPCSLSLSLSLSPSLSFSFSFSSYFFLIIIFGKPANAKKSIKTRSSPAKPDSNENIKTHQYPINLHGSLSLPSFFFHLRRTSETLYVSINTQSNRIETQ